MVPEDIEEKVTVFLSYSHKDKALCDQLRKDLERLPIEVVRALGISLEKCLKSAISEIDGVFQELEDK